MTNSGERSGKVVFPLRDVAAGDTLARHVSRVSAVFDAAPIGVGVWSLEGVLVHANPVLCDLMGRPRPSAVGEVFESFIDPADATEIRAAVEDLWEGTRNFFECSFLCVRPDGTDIWLRTHVLAVYGPGGRPEYLISQIFNFVSGWAVDQGPNAIADQSPVMLWVTDDLGVPRTGNRRCTEFIGHVGAVDDIRGTLFEIVHPDDYERVRGPIRDALTAREPFEFTARSRRHDGQWRWLHNRATPVFDQGSFQGFSGASLDVTDDIRHRHRLEDIERLFESVAEAGPLAMLRTDAVGRVRYANGRWTSLLEDPEVRLTGLGWRSVVAPEHGEEIIERGRRSRDTGESFVMRVRANDAFISPDRRTSGFEGRHWAELRVAPVFDSDGVHDGFVATIADITDEVAAGERADQLARILDAGTDFLLLVERNGAIAYANEAAEDGLGIRSGGADEGHFLMDVLDPDSFTFFHDVVEPVLVEAGRWKGELTMRDASQREVPVSALILAQSGEVGHIDAISIVARDISDLKQAQWSMRQLATHDYLTGLPNRLLLYEHLDQALARFHRLGQTVALLYLDLDRFKPINDELGHHVGDAVIVTLADRIHAVVRDTDTPARIGGDEFAVLVEGFETVELLERVAARLIDSIVEPITVEGITVQVGVSIGIVAADPDTAEADQLIARADAAMYEAKARGRGQYVFATAQSAPASGATRAPEDPPGAHPA